jgi:hypothetical protein
VHPSVIASKIIPVEFIHCLGVLAVIRTIRLKFIISRALKTFLRGVNYVGYQLQVLHREELHNMAVLEVEWKVFERRSVSSLVNK